MENQKMVSKSLASPSFFFVMVAALLMSSAAISADTSCKPRPILIETGPRTDFFNTSVIWVHKCSGHDGFTKNSCVATKWDEKVEYIKGYRSEVRAFRYNNHTKCEMKCTCTHYENCSNIGADKKLKYLVECPHGGKWDFKECKCVAPPNNKDICGAKSSKNSESEVKVSITMFVVALVIEFIIVLIVIFLVMDVCKYRHDTGILHKTAEFVRSVSTGRREDHVTLKRDRNDTGSESFLNGYSTVGGKIDKV